MILADDPERAWAPIRPHVVHQWESYGGTPDGADTLRSAGPAMNPPAFDVVTPEEAAARMRTWLRDMPVAHGASWASIAGMPDELVERHVELLASELAPAVADLGLAA